MKTMLIAAAAVTGLAFAADGSQAQVVTVYSPTVVYAPVQSVTTVAPAPTVTYYAPSVPVTTYYAPSVPITTYSPVPTTVLSPMVPVTPVYRVPTVVYDPTRILPRRRWRLLY